MSKFRNVLHTVGGKLLHKSQETYQTFKQAKKLPEAAKDLVELLVHGFPTLEFYEAFLQDKEYPKKDFEGMYTYYANRMLQNIQQFSPDAVMRIYDPIKSGWAGGLGGPTQGIPGDGEGIEIAYKIQGKRKSEPEATKPTPTTLFMEKKVYKSTFQKFMEQYMQTYISEFLNDKHKEHSNKYHAFIGYLTQSNPYLMDSIDEEQIRKIYDKQYQEYLKSHEKNEFGLEISYVETQLGKIFSGRGGSIPDGSFLYAWNTSDSNGIEKYKKVEQSGAYKDIEVTEKMICEYLLSWGNIPSKIKKSGKETRYHRHPQIQNILSKSKTFVELGPGGVDKLLEYLKFYSDDERDLKKFIAEKNVKLVDVNTEGYVEVRKKLNAITREQKAEGIEADFLNSKSSAYVGDQTCYFMFGGSIGNFSLREIEEILENMKSKQKFKSSHAFITYFNAPDKTKCSPEDYQKAIQKIKAMYGDPDKTNPFYNEASHSAFEDFILSGFRALGIDRTKLEYTVQYEETKDGQPARIKLGAKVKENIEVQTTERNRKYTKKAGEYIRAVQSARFTEDEFKHLTKKSGYDVVQQQSDSGVSVAVLKSKLGINDTHKGTRNFALRTAAIALLIAGGLGWHNYNKNQTIQEKIAKHEEAMAVKKSETYVQDVEKIHAIQSHITKKLMLWYDVGDLTEENINTELKKYLSREDISSKRLDLLYKDIKDDVTVYNFLYYFVSDYLYEDMFTGGAEDVNVLPFLQGYEKKFISTLQYTGPVKEGYNAKEGVYYKICTPATLRNTDKIQGLENTDLVSGYMIKHKGHIDTVNMNKDGYRNIEDLNNMSYVDLSKTENGDRVIIQRFYFDESADKIAKRIGEGKETEILFVKTNEETEPGRSSNLKVDKSLILKCFEANNPILERILESYKTKYGEEKTFQTTHYRDITDEVKIGIIYDLYRNNVFGIKNVSEYTDRIIDTYVDVFHEKYTKYKTALDSLATNKPVNTGKYFDSFMRNKGMKPDSTSKGFNPGLKKK